MDEKVHMLREACVGIQTELSGMKEVLSKLSSNQDDLIALQERFKYTEQFQKDTRLVNDKIFKSLRGLENMRINERLQSLESSRRILISSALLTIGWGTALAIIKLAIG